MATSSLTGGASAARLPSGTDLASLGPSDSSDSGSDTLGTRDRQQLQGDSDATGTGEDSGDPSAPNVEAADILPDHLIYGRTGLQRSLLDEEENQSSADTAADDFDNSRAAFDVPGSALDDPDLMDTTADAGELAQDSLSLDESVLAEDADGFTEAASSPDEPAGLRPVPGHRGLQ
jgi:hypothetical protein